MLVTWFEDDFLLELDSFFMVESGYYGMSLRSDFLLVSHNVFFCWS